ncbi:MAG: addiction module protein [Planctomycetota bacterium]|nr:addiction module protein [Planctomycetota bacterium]
MNEEEIIAAALKLPKDAQLRVLDALRKEPCETDPDLKAAIVKKLEERRNALREGQTKTISAEESLDRVRKTIDGALKQSAPN